VEWVETTGKDITEAKELALDQLGVDEQDAEFEVLEEPRTGLFGRTRGAARIRARVVPKAPRPKQERRRRSRGEGSADKGDDKGGAKRNGSDRQRSGDRNRGSGRGGSSSGQAGERTKDGEQAGGARNGTRAQGGRKQGQKQGTGDGSGESTTKEREMMDEAEQCSTVDEFLTGLSAAFGLETTVSSSVDDEGVIRTEVDGSEVGLLIGPRLGTLDALQEICRNVLQRKADGREHGKVVVDVAGVREMRRTALATFVTEAAESVRADGNEIVFEVMSSGDRKVVHDTIAELDGVESTSVGEDPRRRVVVRPA
jgi:spoIIIJ-associated protein